MIRIVLGAEPGLLRSALRALLSSEADLAVVADLSEAAELVTVTRALRPDVVIVDLDRSDTDPFAVVTRLVAATPDSAVLTLSGQPTSDALRRAIRAGARGVVGKNLPPAEFSQLIRTVAAGHWVVDPAAAVAALLPPASPLTDREAEVLRIVAEGLPLKEIARRMYLAHGTVRNYLSTIMRKTGTRNRLEAVRRAERAGWI